MMFKFRRKRSNCNKNPYDFFDEYEKHYSWDIGRQTRDK